jgi:c-di-GMP-binding flagellar brake protein YcgR
MKSETRNYPRKLMRCQARIALPGGESLRGRTLDVSLSGLSVYVVEQLRVGQACMIAFEARLQGETRQVTASAKVVYSILAGTDGFRTGLQFADIDAANNRTLAELMI